MVRRRPRYFFSTIEDGVVVASRRDAFGKGYVLFYDRDKDGARVLKRLKKG